MLTRIENNQGVITYDSGLMDQLINSALSRYKGRCKLLKKSFSMEEQGVDIDLAFHLKFGTSISGFSKDIFTEIADAVENNFELPVKNIKIYILGIYSKKLAKRDIVVEYNYTGLDNTGN